MKNQFIHPVRVCCAIFLGTFVTLNTQTVSAASLPSEDIFKTAEKSVILPPNRINDSDFDFFDVENDVCESAITLVCNQEPVTYSSVESTAVNTTTCSMGNNGLWFTFTGNGNNITITSTASFDHELGIRSGSCNALDPIICKDASVGSESHLIQASTPGLQYYVYVAHWSSGNATTGDITIGITCVTPPPPPENVVCEDAITLVCNNDPITYSSLGSTAVNTTSCDMGNNGIWFTFTGNGNNITITSTASFDHELGISSGSCNAPDPIICKDGAGTGGTETHLIQASTPGLQYYVYVAHWISGNTTAGDITIGISCVTPPPTPVNDICADAIVLNCGQTVEGTTTGGTTESVGTCVTSLNTSAGVWYAIQGTGNIITATTCSPDGAFFDTKLGVFTGSCGELVCVTGNDDSPAGATDLDCTIGAATANRASTVIFDGVQGTTYYILVTGFSTNTGDFDLTIICDEYDCPLLQANIGDPCDDGNPETFFDEVQDDCTCVGGDNTCVADPGCLAITSSDAYVTVITDDPFCCNNSWDALCQAAYAAAGGLPDTTSPECLPDCPGLGLNIGDPCDDGDPTTEDDTVNAECDCVGVALDCPLLAANFGDPCGTYGTTQTDCSCLEVTYCPSAFSNTVDEFISNVNYAGISNPSGSTTYTNYDITFNITAGETSPITVSVTNATAFEYTETVRVWIDFNQDGTYDPLTEQFDIGSQLVPGGVTLDFTADIAVPADALPGVTGMRVSMRFAAYAEPCDNATFGEVENYMVNISTSQAASLNGNVIWNALCGDRATTVRFYEPGTSNLIGTYLTSVGADGSFTIANVAQGTYDVFVKVDGHLQKGFADVSISTGSNNLVVGLVTPGDVNNVDGVNIDDLTILLSAFGSTTGDPNFNPLADLNCDGDINIDDLTLLLPVFGQSGDNAPLP